MNLEECQINIKSFLDGKEKFDFMNKQILGRIYECYNMISQHIELMSQDKDVPEYNRDIVLGAISDIKVCTIYNPLTNNFINFTASYCELIQNWNNNLDKDDEITNMIVSLMRLIKQHLSIMEACEVLKMILSQIKDFKSWLPPSFDISKHYVSLLEDYEIPKDKGK